MLSQTQDLHIVLYCSFGCIPKVYTLSEIILKSKESLADKDKVEINFKPIWNHYPHLKWN